jgi:hypothetical protein
MENVLIEKTTSEVEEVQIPMSVSEYYEFRKEALRKGASFNVCWKTGQAVVTANIFLLNSLGFFVE